jgi:hypothetical protein
MTDNTLHDFRFRARLARFRAALETPDLDRQPMAGLIEDAALAEGFGGMVAPAVAMEVLPSHYHRGDAVNSPQTGA